LELGRNDWGVFFVHIKEKSPTPRVQPVVGITDRRKKGVKGGHLMP